MTIRTPARSRAITSRAAVVLVVVGSIVTISKAQAAPCRPAVTLAGDSLLVGTIAETLRSRGIEQPEPGCPTEIARVDRRDGAIVISIVDSDGRETSRSVADPATAATLIEQFASDPLPPPRPVTHSIALRDTEEPRILVVNAPALHTVGAIRGAVGIAAETSIASDASVWTGVHAHACVQLGPVCVGGQARIATDLLVSGDAEHDEATRGNGDLQLTADVPLSQGSWSITPGIGVGVGWLHVRRDIMDALGNDTVEIDAAGLRTSAHLIAELPLGRSIVLTLGGEIDLAPTAHTQPFVEETRTAPGEPRWYGHFQVGLEIRQQ